MDNNQNNPFAFDDANTSSADTTSTDANAQATDGFNAQPAFNASYDTQETTNAYDAQAPAFDTQYQQPVYGTNNQVATESKGLAIAGLIVSIIGLLLSCCCGCGIILAIVGLILSIVGIKKCPTAKGMAIAGTIMSAIGIIISVIWICVMLFNPTFKEDFKEGFEAGYNGGITTEATEDIFDDIITADTTDTTDATDATTASEVVNVGEKRQFSILGKTCTIGGAFGDTGLTCNVDEDDQAEIQVGVEPGDDVTGYIVDTNGNEIAYVGLENLTDSKITDINQLAITYISADYYWDADYNEINSDICVYSGIHIGSTVDEVKAAFGKEDTSYTNENRGSLTYYVDDNANIVVDYEDNVVTGITVAYYE